MPSVNVQSVVTAIGTHGLYRWLRDYIARQAIPIWATDAFLDGWLESFGLSRKQATHSRAVLKGTGTVGQTLLRGTKVQTATGQMYATDTDALVLTNGTLSVGVTSITAGSAANLATGSKLTLVTSVSGIAAEFTSLAGIASGSDTETDAQALYRLVQRLSFEPMGGAPHDYARWALQVAGVTRGWGVRNPSGPTSAGVMIMCDGNADGLPTAQQIQAVYSYIRDPKRGPPDELLVFAPNLKIINITLRLTPDRVATREAVLTELRDLFYREAQPSYSMPHSHLIEAVSMATGEYTHEFVAPTLTSGAYFSAGEFDLLTLGSVNFI